MLFCGRSKVNKLILLRRELHPVSLCLFKTALVNLAKRGTVLLCAPVNYIYLIVIIKKLGFLS
jgi:hypothetical protein